MKEDDQEALKKLTLFFPLNPLSFKGQNYQKQKRPATSDQSFFRSQNKFRKIPLLVIYCLSDQVWCCNRAVFELFQKLHLQIYANQFMTS